jgi:hypothetical protein
LPRPLNYPGRAEAPGRFWSKRVRARLVAAHGVKVGTNDVARWYEFNAAGASPTLVQQGNVPGGTADAVEYFPTIEINSGNHLGMTYIESSSTP